MNKNSTLAERLYLGFRNKIYNTIAMAGIGLAGIIGSSAYKTTKAEEPLERIAEVVTFDSEETLTKSDIRFPDEYPGGGQVINPHWVVKGGRMELYDYEGLSGNLRYLFNDKLYQIKSANLSIKVTIEKKDWNSVDQAGIIFAGDPISGNGGTYYEFIYNGREGVTGQFNIGLDSPGNHLTYINGETDLVIPGGINTLEVRYNNTQQIFTDKENKTINPGWNFFINSKKPKVEHLDIDWSKCKDDPNKCPINPVNCTKIDDSTYSCDRSCDIWIDCPRVICSADPKTGEILPETCERIIMASCRREDGDPRCPKKIYDLVNELVNEYLPTDLEGYLGIKAFDSSGGTGEVYSTAYIDNFIIERDAPLAGEGGGLEDQLVPHKPGVFLRGDSNNDKKLDVSDAIFTLNYIFLGGQSPSCLDAADTNDDGQIDISDPIYGLLYNFRGNVTIPPPFSGGIGMDLTVDDNKECETKFNWFQ